jgi:hypothetical protein
VNGATGWTQALALTTVGGGGVRIFYRDNMAAGATVITDTYGSSTAFTGLWIQEVGGTGGFDLATAMTVTSTGTARTSPNGTPTVQPGLCVGFMYNDTGGTTAGTIGAGFSAGVGGWDFGSTPLHGISENQRYTSLSALAATFTANASGNNCGTVALFFKETSTTPSLAAQTATFFQGSFSASNDTPAPPVLSAPLAPLIGNKALGPLGLSGFALRSPVIVQAPANTVSLGSQTATFTQGAFSASSTGSATLGSQTSTFSQGTMTSSTSAGGTVSLGSQTATLSQGAFTASSTGGGTVALGSQTVTFSQGNMSIPGSGSGTSTKAKMNFGFIGFGPVGN